MSDDQEPPVPSDRDLTLRAIGLSYQRARAAQRAVAGPVDGDAVWSAAAGADAEGDELDRPPPLDEAEQAELPSPIVTDARFHHVLVQATLLRGDATQLAGRGRLHRAQAALTGHLDQLHFNAAVVDALHQLDHRTRAQDRVIRRLEAELAEARRALTALERSEGRRR